MGRDCIEDTIPTKPLTGKTEDLRFGEGLRVESVKGTACWPGGPGSRDLVGDSRPEPQEPLARL